MRGNDGHAHQTATKTRANAVHTVRIQIGIIFTFQRRSHDWFDRSLRSNVLHLDLCTRERHDHRERLHLLPSCYLNAGSVFGRVLPNSLADNIGPMNVLVPCAAAMGILALCWIVIVNLAGIIVFVVLYGFFAGAYVSLFAPAVADLVPDMAVIGTWMGMSLFFSAFGLPVGNPISGALVNLNVK